MLDHSNICAWLCLGEIQISDDIKGKLLSRDHQWRMKIKLAAVTGGPIDLKFSVVYCTYYISSSDLNSRAMTFYKEDIKWTNKTNFPRLFLFGSHDR